MRESEINTGIYKPHNARDASYTMFFGVPLKEVFKKGQRSNSSTFSNECTYVNTMEIAYYFL